MYPIEKYRYYTNGTKVIAVSTYAGKTVRGVAKCAPEDEFNAELGKQIAAARCAARIAEKRYDRAGQKYDEAVEAVRRAQAHLEKMSNYFDDAQDEMNEAYERLDDLLDQ